MPAIAITDHGNMFGAFQFVAEASKHEGVKPIVGCEFYLVENRHERSFGKGKKDDRFHQLFLAKNAEGYRNLVKLCSTGYIEGFYSKYPRIDKELVVQYHKGLIATTCCLGARVPQMILRHGEAEARKEFEWWLNIFGEDYYIELQRHNLREQEIVNEVLLRFAKQYNVKIIASNDSHYVEREDSNAHDILLCINTGEKQATPKIDDYTDEDNNKKNKRFAFPNNEFFFKNTQEMTQLFHDLPQAIDNTNEIVGKIDHLKLKKDILLPHFQVPPQYANQDDYLRDLTFKGAKERYRDLTPDVEERLNFELFTVKTMGFAGYFLIVSDFIRAGRDLGVFVGPGRGCLSADAKVVLYDGTTKNIHQIQQGDAVWTHDGTARTVKQTFEYDVNETLLQIKTYYGEETGISLTKDHKVLAEKLTYPKNYDNWAVSTQKARKMPDPQGNLSWLPASDISVGDWLFIPKPQVEIENITSFDLAIFSNGKDLRHDDEFVYHDVLNPLVNGIQKTKKVPRHLTLNSDWYTILGLFTGDGWFRKDYRPEISFIFNLKDTDKIEWFKSKISDFGFELREQFYEQVVQIHILNKHLYLFFKHIFNKYNADAHTKHVPDILLRGSDENIFAFLQGYCFADGHESEFKIKFTTVSRTLADQIRFLCWRVGIPASIATDKREGDKREAFKNRTTAYMVSIPKDARIGVKTAEKQYVYRLLSDLRPLKQGEQDGILVKVRSIETVEDIKKVYDFEVDTNHNYLTSSFLVHNSAAGSAVAYCIGITNIDPIKYKLLFERFLNPDRKSMPDIDTDFDDEGRQKVIDYVVEKYGKNQVAHIATYGTMAAKMSIKDVARVMDLQLSESNILAKLVPEKPGIKLARVLKAPIRGEGSLEEKEGLNPEDLANCEQLREVLNGSDLRAQVLKEALILEGSVRGTGIHAAGIIIAPDDLTNILPVSTAKDVNLLITQFEGSVIEDAGVIKMDFLGLKTLTILKEALRLIKQNHGIDIDLDNIPLDDKKTYELYQRGETNGTFQFESMGMQKYLRDLKPDTFDDLIAMNALYRPGPLAYIPNYINRKHGIEPITYDLPAMEEYLKETYGISVYQEQIMLLSQKLANFSKGDADVLRKAMGKKQIAVLNKMKAQFLDGCEKNGHPRDVCEKVWSDWEAFASYAFNKSHSTCYAFVAYQTAYLKAHYPAEYMAAVLTNNSGNIEKVTFFMEECRNINIPVKGPDVNESDVKFSVNKKGEIRFALSAIKGVGEAAVEGLIEERRNNGAFADVFDFVRRMNLRTLNKRVIEGLVYAGGFDSFNISRATFFTPSDKYETFIEHLLRYGANYQEQKKNVGNSLFGGGNAAAQEVMLPTPSVPKAEDWNLLQQLNYEREVVGIYLSGHPLDDYKLEIKTLKICPLDEMEKYKGQKVKIVGFVINENHRTSRKGVGFGIFTLQDYHTSLEISLFNDDYEKYKHILRAGASVYAEGEYKPKYNGDGYELRVRDIRLLASMSNSIAECITLTIPIELITEMLIRNLERIFIEYKGEHRVKVCLIDKQNRQILNLYSTDYKVAINSELINSLEKENLEYQLN